jgi:energy-coupling factor transporter ATP-binding protein EcfA2
MAKFDLKAAIDASMLDLDQTALMSMVLGPSGSGKSSLCGSFDGDTLYIYTSGETHGVKAANAIHTKLNKKGKIIPFRLSDDPNKAYADLLEVLKEAGDYKAIVLDGAPEIEYIIRSTQQFKIGCMNASGKHNNFAEGEVVLRMFRPLILALKDMSRQGINSCVTCTLDVQSMAEDGEILESKPRMSTYSVVEGLLQQFPAYFCIGRMSNGDEKEHRIQFLAGVSRVSKDQAGIIRKTLNFNPRLSGVLDVPNTMPADLAGIVAFLSSKVK